MSSDFPRSPRVMKGGLVAYQLPELTPTIIVYQYNPDEVQRQLRLRGGGGGGRGDSNRVNGPPEETLSFTLDIDAALGLHFADEGSEPVSNPN